jgi:hypothetical protein
MSSPVPSRVPPGTLSAEEEVTLRRVAYGQSEVRSLRAADLARLHALKLIEDSKDGPRLTREGKARFTALSKPSAQVGPRQFDGMLDEIRKQLTQTYREAQKPGRPRR